MATNAVLASFAQVIIIIICPRMLFGGSAIHEVPTAVDITPENMRTGPYKWFSGGPYMTHCCLATDGSLFAAGVDTYSPHPSWTLLTSSLGDVMILSL